MSDVPVPTGVAINASSLTVIEGTSIDFTGSATDSTSTSLTYAWDLGMEIQDLVKVYHTHLPNLVLILLTDCD